MFIVLRSYELNTLLRRRDDVDYADLTKARVLENSVRFSENELHSALKAALSSDTLLYLDLRLRPDSIHSVPQELPPLEIPDHSDFVYQDQPQMRMLKTYRLDYLLSRQSREALPPYETEIDGKRTRVRRAPQPETVASSLECESSELRHAVSLLSAPANGFLSWLRIRIFDDALQSGRMAGHLHMLDYAEPRWQIDI
jgi:hypothetical protein